MKHPLDDGTVAVASRPTPGVMDGTWDAHRLSPVRWRNKERPSSG
jgi:hypothetical protein